MLQQVLALTIRSLREDIRSVRSHLLRFAFVGYVFALLIFVSADFRQRSAPGLWVFQYICWGNFALITVGGLSVFATAITEEKEEDTLGLLRMAGVSPISLLLGKSTTRLLTALLILAVQFPFTLLSITLGGVIWSQIAAVYVELTAWLIVVANVGLMASVMCARSTSAGSLSGFAIAVWLIVVPTLYGMAGWANANSGYAFQGLVDALRWAYEANAFNRLNIVLNSGFQDSIWTSGATAQFAAGLLLFLAATLTFDWFTRDNPALAPTRWWMPKRRTRRAAPSPGAASHAAGKSASPFFFPGLSPVPAWSNALLWKDFHFLAGGYITAVFKLFGYGAIIFLFLMLSILVEPMSGRGLVDWLQLAGGTAFGIGLLGGAVELALISSKVFWEETRWNTWPALVMLPRSLWYVTWSKVAGMALSIIPALIWVGFGCVVHLDNFVRALGNGADEAFLMLSFAGCWYLMFLHATAYLSLWVKWGALPLSFVLLFIVGPMTGGCCIGLVGGGSEEGVIVVLGFLFLLISAGLHAAIAHRLVQIAER